jgi:DNA-binding CsgD family transcriptional regulator
MIRHSTMSRTDSRAISYIEKYVTVVGVEKKEEVLALFDKMHLFFPHWVIMTCSFMHPAIRYSSPNWQYVFGQPEENLNFTHRQDHYNAVHEADLEDLQDCFSMLYHELEGIDPAEHHCYRFVAHYRYKKPNGQYMYLHDEKASLKLGDGNLYYVMYRDITAEQVFTGVKMEMFKQGPVLERIKEYKPGSERNPLSKREGQLVTLIRQGLSTKEIAWHLNISHNTVRNIKSRLFEKYNVSNMIELLNITA